MCPPSLYSGAPGYETLPNGTLVFTSQSHRVGTDALLLANFCVPKGGWAKAGKAYALSVCDLGSGCGIVALSLLDGGFPGRAVGVEIDPEGAQLLARAAKENNLSLLTAHEGDARAYRTPYPFSLVVSNPPYYNAGARPADPVRAAARHEESLSLPALCAAARRLLKDRGRFCLCYPPARLADLFCALREAGLEPKRLQFVRKAAGSPPWLALVEARKGGGTELSVLPDHILPPGEPLQY